jgi:hypothetical protein
MITDRCHTVPLHLEAMLRPATSTVALISSDGAQQMSGFVDIRSSLPLAEFKAVSTVPPASTWCFTRPRPEAGQQQYGHVTDRMAQSIVEQLLDEHTPTAVCWRQVMGNPGCTFALVRNSMAHQMTPSSDPSDPLRWATEFRWHCGWRLALPARRTWSGLYSARCVCVA